MCPAPYADSGSFFPLCDGMVSGVSVRLQISLEVSKEIRRILFPSVILILIQDDLALRIPFSASVKPHEAVGGRSLTGF